MSSFTIRMIPTENPAKQNTILYIERDGGDTSEIPLGTADCDGRDEWAWSPRPIGAAWDLAQLRQLVEVLTNTPRPTQEEVDAYYDAHPELEIVPCMCGTDYLDPDCTNPEHINPPKGFE